ncbi:response regulator transcription factor [Chloroflexota bacterium]
MTARIKTMVISSDPTMLRFLRDNLSGDDYPLASMRYNGDELQESLAREEPDLVILDIMMPELTGIELCLRIRRWSEAPILMLSTWEAGPDMIRGLDLSAENYLSEPFRVDELRDRINVALQCNFAAAGIYPDKQTNAS